MGKITLRKRLSMNGYDENDMITKKKRNEDVPIDLGWIQNIDQNTSEEYRPENAVAPSLKDDA